MKRMRLLYFLRRAAVNLRGAPVPALVTAATIAVVVFLAGAFWIAVENGQRALVRWAESGEALTVYAARGASPAALERLRRAIESRPTVARVRPISPEEALEELRGVLGPGDLLAGVDARGLLPPAFAVTVKSANLEPATVEALVGDLRSLEGVEAVDSEAAWVERVGRLTQALRWIAAGWASFLAAGALLIIGNSTRLAALTRREEIEVLRLVGASEAFVLVPFFYEGFLEGVLGAILGLGSLAVVASALQQTLAADRFAGPWLADARFLAPASALCLAAAGPLLGAIGSVGAARRFLQRMAL